METGLPAHPAPDVYFPIEIVSREFAGHLLMAVELAARGLNAVIGHKPAVLKVMFAATRPGILFYKGGAAEGAWRSEAEHTQVGLDPEAGIVYRRFEDFFERRPLLHDLRSTAAQFCYGPDDYETFRRRVPELAHRFHLTGSPRVNLWGTAGDDYYAEDVRQIKEQFGQLVLFATSGGFVHERYAKAQRLTTDQAWGASDVGRRLVQVAREVAQMDAALNVVIRPHPSDSWNALRERTADIANIHVQSHRDLSAWVRASSVVVHPGMSTAALEAVSAGVPALSLGVAADTNVATDISHPAADAATVLELHHRRLVGTLPTFPAEEAELLLRHKLLHPNEGAAERIADIILREVPIDGPSGLPARSIRKHLKLGKIPWKPTSYDWSATKSPAFKRPNLELDLIERKITSLVRSAGKGPTIKLSEIAANCILLS